MQIYDLKYKIQQYKFMGLHLNIFIHNFCKSTIHTTFIHFNKTTYKSDYLYITTCKQIKFGYFYEELNKSA